MGFRRYKGPVTTVRQAVMADLTLTLRCLQCSRERHIFARRLFQDHRELAELPLGGTDGVFRCTECRCKEIVVTAPVRWVY